MSDEIPTDLPSDESLNIGSQVRAARIRAGLTARELAQIVETSESSLSRIENDLQSPTVRTLIRIANATHLSFTIAPCPKEPSDV
jgi:transcriptional regulator with XRE-family HTH domain